MPYKLEVYDMLFEYLKDIKSEPVIIMGDLNIAHTELDLARPKQNQNNTMFTPAEREKLDTLTALGYVDTFRLFNRENGHYSWWPYAQWARDLNLGWRIDYVFVSPSLKDKVKEAFILKEVPGSDHCPVGIEIEI